MNISRIRQMASQGDMSTNGLRYLIDCHGECEHLDFKETLELDSDYGCASFGKDVLGMKNVGGGYLVIGVKDKTWQPVGLGKKLALDTKLLRDKVRRATGVDLDADITQHEIFATGEFRLFALILIRSSTKRSKLRVPSLAKINFRNGDNWGIRQGDIYIRRGDSTTRITSDIELQNLLDDLEARYQEEELEQANTSPSPFAVESGLFRILPREFDKFVGREKYKSLLKVAIEGDPRIWIVNLHGPGGVGKSALATWLAYEYYQRQTVFEAILQLSAKDLELSTDTGIRHLRPTLFSLEDFLDRVLHLFAHSEYCQADVDKRKEVVTEILRAYSTLLILDNMETMSDGRIMEFIRHLPPTTQAKALLTSRRRTSEWEYPIQVEEFDEVEVSEFVAVRNAELGIGLPLADQSIIRKIRAVTGGLPLAIQWTLGEYAKTRDLRILSRALTSDSPLLEFSFRNSWNVLDNCAQRALAVLSIFENPPTAQEWRTALEWPVDTFEEAVASVVEVTFVSERTEQTTGKVVYSALPITKTFAQNELSKMGDLEAQARLRYQGYRNRMELANVETRQYTSLFERFQARTDIQKKAIILSRIAEGQARSLGYQAAAQFYKEALELDPRSVYALVSFGLFKMELGNYGEAVDLISRASTYSTRENGYYVYFSLSRVYDQSHDRVNRIRCLRKALEYEPTHSIARHSLGVALSQSGVFGEALDLFEGIISEELSRNDGPSESLAYAFKTKIITLRRAGREAEAQATLQSAIHELSQHRHLTDVAERLRIWADEE
jgi:tetratricopeptide (TPR) repeat protein